MIWKFSDLKRFNFWKNPRDLKIYIYRNSWIFFQNFLLFSFRVFLKFLLQNRNIRRHLKFCTHASGTACVPLVKFNRSKQSGVGLTHPNLYILRESSLFSIKLGESSSASTELRESLSEVSLASARFSKKKSFNLKFSSHPYNLCARWSVSPKLMSNFAKRTISSFPGNNWITFPRGQFSIFSLILIITISPSES